jgi:5-oxoprolinase (ATP-hydrolysing)
MLNLSSGSPIPESLVDRIRMGTTVATNALLQRNGAPVALLITRGFRDLLAIGYQNRPELFQLAIRKPEQLYRCVKEVEERIDHRGKIITPLELDAVENELGRLKRMGIGSLAVVLMHAWKNGRHEAEIAHLAQSMGFRQVAVSHRLMPLIKIVGRAQTTVVDAYLSTIIARYVDSIRTFTGSIPLEFMQSSGGLTDAHAFSGKDAIISGPAGGVIGMASVAALNRVDEVIGFDMGGTSTDVSRFGGNFEKTFEVETAGVRFQAPSMRVNTVAAGGGSLLWFDGQKLRVGPESAGADPGPACYGRGGPLALTDANLFLGRILPTYFPRTFGPDQDQTLESGIVARKFTALANDISSRLSSTLSSTDLALGFVKIANETMAKPIKEISVARGFDIRSHALICFGGAAAQHVCALARILGVRRIIIHPLAGLLSAYGIAVADHLRYAARSLITLLTAKVYQSLEKQFQSLAQPLIQDLLDRGLPADRIETRRFLDLRPQGTDTYLSIPFTEFDAVASAFLESYSQLFGFRPSSAALELVNIRVEVLGKGGGLDEIESEMKSLHGLPAPLEFVDVRFDSGSAQTPVYRRGDLTAGQQIRGPAIVAEEYSTVVIEPGFRAIVSSLGHLILEHSEQHVERIGAQRDPIMLEVFNNLFMSVAEQMGSTLAQTAHSTNIKERLDFSCAIFDREGNLVANAPHIPVHLGAMSESVKAIIEANKDTMTPGDVYLTNNPHRGGSHLPDVTVISPVFEPHGAVIFFTASRGHHADIGGITPGSMSPFATSIQDEGVVIDNFLLVRAGAFDEKGIRQLLSASHHPARNITERVSDLKAQVAANKRGAQELHRLVEKYTLDTVQSYMQHVRENAAEAMRDALGRFLTEESRFSSSFTDYLDDGACIQASILIEPGDHPPHTHHLTIDFTGTSAQLPNSLNAPVAVTKAAVLYVLRCIIDRDIPLNSGCLLPVNIHIPQGCLLNPSPDAAVVGGNVETSQRVVDVLFGALGVAAASQGTMNNLLFGREDNQGRQYYETIAGGSGATADHDGASAVQVHMTNTRITDPEVLEQRFPEIRLERFAIRRGSGGRGKHRGGHGVIRILHFLKPRRFSILSERRRHPPYGVQGGSPGAKGRNLLVQKDSRQIDLGGKVSRLIQAGERLIIKTPGGGGYGQG